MQCPSASRGQFQGIVQPNTWWEESKPAFLQPAKLCHGLEACMGTGRPGFSIPDTILLSRKCPDAWALRPPRCPSKNRLGGEASGQRRESASSGAALPMPMILAGTEYASEGYSTFPRIPGCWHLWFCVSSPISIPNPIQVARVFKKDPLQKTLSSFPSPALRSLPEIQIYLVYDLCGLLWKEWLLFHIRFSFR